MQIGHHNIFEVGAKLAGGGEVGNGNIFECRSVTGEGCIIGDGCTIGVKAQLAAGTKLPDETVVVGPGCLSHEEPGAKDSHAQAIMKHVEVLKETLPRCHHLKKSGK